MWIYPLLRTIVDLGKVTNMFMHDSADKNMTLCMQQSELISSSECQNSNPDHLQTTNDFLVNFRNGLIKQHEWSNDCTNSPIHVKHGPWYRQSMVQIDCGTKVCHIEETY